MKWTAPEVRACREVLHTVLYFQTPILPSSIWYLQLLKSDPKYKIVDFYGNRAVTKYIKMKRFELCSC